MNNPLDLLSAIQNPKQFVINYLKKNSNPIINNMVTQAEAGNIQEVEQIARNLCKEKGIDFDKQVAPYIKF